MRIVPRVFCKAGAESVKGETPGMFNVQPPTQVKIGAIKLHRMR